MSKSKVRKHPLDTNWWDRLEVGDNWGHASSSLSFGADCIGDPWQDHKSPPPEFHHL